MPIPLPDKPTRHDAQPGHGRQPPKRQPHDPDLQPLAVDPAAQGGADGPGGAAGALPDAVDGAEHGRVRRAVVDQDGGGGRREGAADDLEEEEGGEGDPDGRAGFGLLGWGGGGGGGGDEGEKGDEGVDEGEAVERDAPGADGAETLVDKWVEEELECDADGS